MTCYSGKCEFETNMGECTIYNFSDFEKKYNYTPCLIGGVINNEKDKNYYINNIEEIEKIKKNTIRKKDKTYGSNKTW